VNVQGREVGLRPGEIENSKPLGFASYRTVGALRNIEYRILPPQSATAGVADKVADARRAYDDRDNQQQEEKR